MHYQSVVISIQAAQPFTWDKTAGIRAPATPPRAGDAEFRIPALCTAVVVEAAAPADLPGITPAERLAGFRHLLESRTKLVFAENNGQAVGRYLDRTGHQLECRFGGDDFIDGQKIDYAAWPAHESPWAHQPHPSSVVPSASVGHSVSANPAPPTRPR